MLGITNLNIRLSPGRAALVGRDTFFDRIVGGPVVLLEWLETQLGLPQADVHRAARVMQYADVLSKVRGVCFERSLAADRWETASELLQRRDELMLCGWDGVSSDGCCNRP